jgi:hypothetical protein
VTKNGSHAAILFANNQHHSDASGIYKNKVVYFQRVKYERAMLARALHIYEHAAVVAD